MGVEAGGAAPMYREVAGVVGLLAEAIDLDRQGALTALELATRVVDTEPTWKTPLFWGVEAVIRGGEFAEEDYKEALPRFFRWAEAHFSSSMDHRFHALLNRVLARRDVPPWLREEEPWRGWIEKGKNSPLVWSGLALGGRLRDEEVWELGEGLQRPGHAHQTLFILAGVSAHLPLPEELARRAWKLSLRERQVYPLLSLLPQASVPLDWVLEFLHVKEKGFPSDPRAVGGMFSRVVELMGKRPMDPEETLEAERALRGVASLYRSALWAHPAYPLDAWEDKLPWVLLHPLVPGEALLGAIRGRFDEHPLFAIDAHLFPPPSELVGKNPALTLERLREAYEGFPEAPRAPLMAWRERLASSPKGKGPRASKEEVRFLLKKGPPSSEFVAFALHPEVSLDEVLEEVERMREPVFHLGGGADKEGVGHPVPACALLALRAFEPFAPRLESTPFFHPILAAHHRLPPWWGRAEVDLWRRGRVALEAGGL